MKDDDGEVIYCRAEIEKTGRCMCYTCMSSFGLNEIPGSMEEDVFCPECGYDTVLSIEDEDYATLYWMSILLDRL